MPSALRPFATLRHDRRAVAAVEMALIGSFVFLPMLGGFVGISQALAIQNALDRGLHAGLIAAWGQPDLTASSTTPLNTAMTTAVQQGANLTPAPTVAATAAWYCISPTGTRSGATAVAQGTSCTGGNILAKYVTITASATFTPVLDVGITGWNQTGGTSGLVTLSNTATIRVQCKTASC